MPKVSLGVVGRPGIIARCSWEYEVSEKGVACFWPWRPPGPPSVSGVVSLVNRMALVVNGAVTIVDEALPGGAGGDEAKTLSLETSETGGRALSSKTRPLQGCTWALLSKGNCVGGAAQDHEGSGCVVEAAVRSGAVIVAESLREEEWWAAPDISGPITFVCSWCTTIDGAMLSEFWLEGHGASGGPAADLDFSRTLWAWTSHGHAWTFPKTSRSFLKDSRWKGPFLLSLFPPDPSTKNKNIRLGPVHATISENLYW